MKSLTKTLMGFLLLVCIIGSCPIFPVDGADWLAGWGYRQGFTVSGSSGAGTNYQVYLNVTYDANMQADFDDLRFTSNNSIEWDYWIEYKVDSSYADVWVEIADNLNSTQTGFMYYGNGAVSTTMNGEDTFPLMFEDWSTQSIRPAVWDIVHVAGGITYSAVDANHFYVAKFDADAGDSYGLTTDYDAHADLAVRFRTNIEGTGVGNQARIGTGYAGGSGIAYIMSDAGTESFVIYDSDHNPDHQAMTGAYVDSWIVFDITRDGTNAKLYADDILIETGSFEPDIVNNSAGYIRCIDSEDDVYNDWFLVRQFIDTEPVAIWGIWGTVNSIEFFLHVGWNPAAQFGYDMFFIFLGLIMIPTSTMYFVRGGKEAMSRDKVFYFLIAFVIGWSLVIGGVMP